jgi:hypothetical protein
VAAAGLTATGKENCMMNHVTQALLLMLLDTASVLHEEDQLPRPAEYSYGQAYLIVCALDLDTDIAEKVIAPMLRDGRPGDVIAEAVLAAAQD